MWRPAQRAVQGVILFPNKYLDMREEERYNRMGDEDV
jgi:hypothetical protein